MSDDDDPTMAAVDSPQERARRPTGRPREPSTRSRDSGRPVGGSARSHKKTVPAGKVDIAASMEVTYRMLGQFWAMKDPYCGPVLMEQAGPIGAAWESYANANPRVRKILEQFALGGGALPVVMAHLPLVLVLIQHHTPQGQATVMAQAEAAAAERGMTVEDFIAAQQPAAA